MKSKSKKQNLISLIISLSLICLGILCLFLILKNASLRESIEGKGEIGDLIGGTTAPFIGLIGVCLTYIAFNAQNKFNEIQTFQLFESTFFNLISFYKDIRGALYFNISQNDKIYGSHALSQITEVIDSDIKQIKKILGIEEDRKEITSACFLLNYYGLSYIDKLDFINSNDEMIYQNYFQNKENRYKFMTSLSDLFGSIHSVLSYIRKSEALKYDEEKKHFYFNLFKQLLNVDDVILLRYFCYCEIKEKDWCDEYIFLKGLFEEKLPEYLKHRFILTKEDRNNRMQQSVLLS